MVIRQTLTTEVKQGGGLKGYLESIIETANELAQETADEIEPQVLNELQAEVGAVKYPIKWASDKQRKAFFATDGFGRGIPTQRTGKLQDSWRVYLQPSDNGFQFVIENTADYSKFVYGSLAQDAQAALRFQQPFHANTGYQAATKTVSFWQDAFDELFREKLADRLAEFANASTTKRAYTKGKRRI